MASVETIVSSPTYVGTLYIHVHNYAAPCIIRIYNITLEIKVGIVWSLKNDHFVEDRRRGQEGRPEGERREERATEEERRQYIPRLPRRRMPAKEAAKSGFATRLSLLLWCFSKII